MVPHGALFAAWRRLAGCCAATGGAPGGDLAGDLAGAGDAWAAGAWLATELAGDQDREQLAGDARSAIPAGERGGV